MLIRAVRETLILMLLQIYVFIEMVKFFKYKHFKMILYYCYHMNSSFALYYTIFALHWVRYDVLWSTEKQHWPRPKAAVNIAFQCSIIYNYCTSLSAIWCVMDHWKTILTKAEVRGQYCFSVLHSTSHCTTWSAVIVLLHLTFPIFFCTWINF